MLVLSDEKSLVSSFLLAMGSSVASVVGTVSSSSAVMLGGVSSMGSSSSCVSSGCLSFFATASGESEHAGEQEEADEFFHCV